MNAPRITNYGDIALDEYGNDCERYANVLRKPYYCDGCDRPIRRTYWKVDTFRFHARCVKVHTVLS